MKATRNIAVLFLVLLGAVAANAQTALQGKFRLADEVRWGEAVLAAGQYSLVIESTQTPVRVVIQSANGKTATIAVAETSVDASPGGSYIFITGAGKNRLVRSMNLPQLGTELVYKSLTVAERETLYASASQTVPVQLAKK
jgi:hypothetical protein